MYFSKNNFQHYVFIIKSLTMSCQTEISETQSKLDAPGENRHSNALLCVKVQYLWVTDIHVAST